MSRPFISSIRDGGERARSWVAGFDWLALLVGRLSVGLLFLSAGWGKVHNLSSVTAFFESLGIPAPGFHAVLVGYTELLCGAALVVGLLSRLSAIPLMVTMVVAMVTAKRDEIHGLFDLIGQSEFTIFAVLAMIAVLGPGKAALDGILAYRRAPGTLSESIAS